MEDLNDLLKTFEDLNSKLKTLMKRTEDTIPDATEDEKKQILDAQLDIKKAMRSMRHGNMDSINELMTKYANTDK